MQHEFELYETPLLVDVEEASGDDADGLICVTGGGPTSPAPA